jgi:hypothetical protein
MKASTTYQAILEEGRLEEAGRLFRRVGEERFGTPPAPEQQVVLDLIIDLITETSRFEELLIRCLHVGSWAELLQRVPPPAAPPRRARGEKRQ